MSTLSIPAREIRKGDLIDVGGYPHTVECEPFDVPLNQPHPWVVYFSADDSHGTLRLDPDALVTVERRDPDEALVERIAEAICTARHWSYQDSSEELRDRYRLDARAALAVMRGESK